MHAGHTRARRAAAAAACLAALIAVASCSRSDPGPTATGDAVAQALAAVEADGGDADQLAAFADGVITYDEYEAAMTRAFDCQRALGATVTVTGTVQAKGVTRIEATTTAGTADQKALDDCYVQHAQAVDRFWQVSSPDAVAFAERRAKALLPALRSCLTEHGVDWADDESFSDLLSKGVVGSTGEPADDESGEVVVGSDGSQPQFDCAQEIGYPTWNG